MNKNYHKNIRILAWFNFFTDFKLYAPVAILYFSKVSGSFALGMSIFAIAQLSSAIFELPTGIISDFVGRKKTVVFGAISAVIYACLYAIPVYPVLIIGAVFEGISRSFYSGNNEALLHESLAESKCEIEYDEVLGKTSSLFQIALAISALMGSVIASFSFVIVMWLSVIPQIMALFTSFQISEPKVERTQSGNIYRHLAESISQIFSNPILRKLNLASIIGYAVGEAGYQFRAAFISTLWPLWAVGIANVMANIGASLSYYFSGKIIKKFSEIKVLIFTNIYMRIVGIIAVGFPTVFSPVLMASSSLGFGTTEVAESSLLQKLFSNKNRATLGSLNSFAGSIGFAVFSIVLGWFADTFNPAQALLLMQCMLLSVPIIYWSILKKTIQRGYLDIFIHCIDLYLYFLIQ